MRWSKVRKVVHQSFAESVRDRVRVDATNADPRGVAWQDTCKGWIAVDGEVIAHVDPHRLRKLTLSLPSSDERGGEPQVILIVEPRSNQKVPSGAQVGDFLDFPEACWEYLHSNLNESLRSRDPFISSLAVLNAKVGRTRLQRVSTWDLHPLTRWMLEFRLRAEQDSRAGVRGAATAAIR
ncbi:MAG TPA: hypothetical protein VEZ14_11295 [Dehalococcoidia bacterium]|nr:hypothetical protein [Dehalococcoidia bacterium]